ncbi:hypothetical protein CWE15_07745 [Aliidiomarina taiwanensis]|uniref:TIGR04219 family outer membrane beta-barrel protein n=1 Tax=Aliidiomarina taiwanensis TaxID=946228 RepID=A0A432X123_9GAMM|nr:TIGR04219 family outer membrane beta-barrel protein [Aliidiomarina taiwanensis]RUO40030.1 hypothetical protein CWE15_07745 [Aliidiomarina taiwanensis]
MKSKALVSVTALGLLASASFSSKADFLFGVHAEAQYWQAENSGDFGYGATTDGWGWDDEGATRLRLSLNHFLPLIPNVMVERQMLESTGQKAHTTDFVFQGNAYPAPVDGSTSFVDSTWDLGHDTLTLYYRFFDNSLVEFYFGVAAKKFNGDVAVQVNDQSLRQSIDETIPMGYLRLTAGLPFTGLSVRAEGYPVSIGDHEVFDMEASFRYEFLDTLPLDGTISAGYRVLNLKFEGASGLYSDFEVKGPFVNLALHF